MKKIIVVILSIFTIGCAERIEGKYVGTFDNFKLEKELGVSSDISSIVFLDFFISFNSIKYSNNVFTLFVLFYYIINPIIIFIFHLFY